MFQGLRYPISNDTHTTFENKTQNCKSNPTFFNVVRAKVPLLNSNIDTPYVENASIRKKKCKSKIQSNIFECHKG